MLYVTNNPIAIWQKGDIMKNLDLFDYVDEPFKIGTSKYRLLSDVDPEKFVLYKANYPLVVIDKMTIERSNAKQISFESHEPLSHFEDAKDRNAIKLAINLLEQKYHS